MGSEKNNLNVPTSTVVVRSKTDSRQPDRLCSVSGFTFEASRNLSGNHLKYRASRPYSTRKKVTAIFMTSLAFWLETARAPSCLSSQIQMEKLSNPPPLKVLVKARPAFFSFTCFARIEVVAKRVGPWSTLRLVKGRLVAESSH